MEIQKERKHIRHPTDIPINWTLDPQNEEKKETLNNISEGGLSFISQKKIKIGVTISISIPIREPVETLVGVVVWCQKNIADSYDVGVKFFDDQTNFSMRMVEQVCYIEHYKKEIFQNEGRELTGEQAAIEWISKYASDFPR